MKLSKTNFLILVGVMILIVAVVFAFLTADRRSKEGAAVGDTSQSIPHRVTPRLVSPASLQSADVVKMTPEDWIGRFRKSPSEVSAVNEQEILSLAEELEGILKENPDPNGIEALVFSDAILTLLAEGHEPQ